MSARERCIWRQETPLGVFWAAVSGGQVVASGFGPPPEGAGPAGGGAVWRTLRLALEAWLAGSSGATPDLPVDPGGTAFQRAVLAAASAVPFGATSTYGDLAARLGRPGAAQAVGQALARNPCLLLIPCHRVVPASGGLGGYAGGHTLKAALLAHEAALAAGDGQPSRDLKSS
jgi:methylated-DNA-[protein]-cysteine S-methyltransferase